MKLIVIWFNPNKKIYYHKIVKNSLGRYFVGMTNQYDHEVVLLIPLEDCFITFSQRIRRILKRFFKTIISFLEKIYKKI